MSLLGGLVSQLKADCPSFSSRFSIARSINNPEPTALPEGWVGRWNSVAAPSTTVGNTVQLITREVYVVFAATMEDEDDNVDHYKVARDEIIDSLIGIQVGPQSLPLSFSKEEFMESPEGYTMARLTFSFYEHKRG